MACPDDCDTVKELGLRLNRDVAISLRLLEFDTIPGAENQQFEEERGSGSLGGLAQRDVSARNRTPSGANCHTPSLIFLES